MIWFIVIVAFVLMAIFANFVVNHSEEGGIPYASGMFLFFVSTIGFSLTVLCLLYKVKDFLYHFVISLF